MAEKKLTLFYNLPYHADVHEQTIVEKMAAKPTRAQPVASSGTAHCVVAFGGMPPSRMVAAMRFQPQSSENDM